MQTATCFPDRELRISGKARDPDPRKREGRGLHAAGRMGEGLGNEPMELPALRGRASVCFLPSL